MSFIITLNLEHSLWSYFEPVACFPILKIALILQNIFNTLKNSEMIPAVFGKLRDSGFFFDAVARDIEANFVPNLLENVKAKVLIGLIVIEIK